MLIKRIQALPGDSVFCYDRKNKFMIMTYPRLMFWMKKWLHEAGIPSKGFTMHSYRRGGVTFLHSAKIPTQVIKLLGNWASEAYLHYIDITLNSQVQAMCDYAEILEKQL